MFMNHKHNLYIPTYLDSFQCIGGECSDTCCRGWQVSIDKQTYKKYRNLNTSELGNRLSKYICKNKQVNQGEDYAYVQLERGQCPFLTSTCRCEIQEKVGASYLSKTCRTYPRHVKKIGNDYEMTGVLSCPVIAEQVLLGENPFTLTTKEFKNHEISTYSLSKVMNETEVSLPIRNWFIELIQNHQFSLQDRLITMVMFAHLIKTEKPFEIEKFLTESSNLINTSDWQQQVFELRNFSNHNQALKHFIAISKRQLNKGNPLNVFILMLNESLKGLSNSQNQDTSNHLKNSLIIQETSDGKSFDQILENYTIHYLMETNIPFTPEKIMQTIEQLIIRLSFFRILWAGLISQYGEIDSNQIIQTIQKFSKHYEHTAEFKTSMNSIFEESENVQITDYLALII